MQLRRSLIELEDQNVQNSIEVSKRQLVVVQGSERLHRMSPGRGSLDTREDISAQLLASGYVLNIVKTHHSNLPTEYAKVYFHYDGLLLKHTVCNSISIYCHRHSEFINDISKPYRIPFHTLSIPLRILSLSVCLYLSVRPSVC